MKPYFVLILFVFSLSSCNYLKNVNLLTSGDLERDNFVDSIPFELKKDLVIVKAQINGKNKALDFIFDTGAFNSKINHTLTKEYNLVTKALKENEDSNGNVKTIEVTQLQSLKLGTTIFRNIGAGKVEYAEDSPSPCIAEHGIIGANLIKLAHWKIDYQKQMLYFSDEPFTIENSENAITLDYDAPTLSETPKVELNIEGRTVGNLIIDTGSNGGFRLPASVQGSFSSENTETFYDRSVSGIYGFKADTLVFKTLQLNDFNTRFPIEFSVLGKGLIGNEFLKYFVLYMDTDEQTITLVPQSEIKVQPIRPFSVIPAKDNTWIVNRVSANASHGLKLGDTLINVNHNKPLDLYQDYCDYVMNNHKLINTDTITIETKRKEILNIPIQ